MDAQVPAASLKTFYRALQCLGSIGDSIWIEARAEQLELIGTNASQSVYARIVFPAEFFDAYNAQGEEDDSVFRCRVQAKQLAGIFRARTHAVEQCILSIEQTAEPVHISNSSSTQGECQLVVQLVYKQRVCRTHRLFYEECETFHSTYDRGDCKGRWRVAAAHAVSWVSHFARGAEEMTLKMSHSAVQVRSWTSGSVAQPDTTRALHTELNVDPADFDSYHVTQPVELTLALREFRAVLRYAERMAAPISAFFDHPGWPLLLEVAPPSSHDARDHRQVPPTAEFVLATIADDGTPASKGTATPATRPRVQAAMIPESIDPATIPRVQASMVLESIDPDTAPSPAGTPAGSLPYVHSREGFTPWSSSSRSDSLLATPASIRRANTARADSIAASHPESLSGGQGPATQPVPESRAPIARSYRLLDMPRPHAPPGLTDSQPDDEQPADEQRPAPPGMVQTTLPYQTTTARRLQGNVPIADSDHSSDEELDATPPPPSKRMRALF
ncbi:hypothetical protein GGI21_004322 [Coemansia aciculifera]|nr:hypothetical protein GGI21_004322 [Coemansia aciculifera]